MTDNPQRIASPCVRNCCLNDDDICLGCFRSLHEITQWGQAQNSARQKILEDAKKRKNDYNEKYKR